MTFSYKLNHPPVYASVAKTICRLINNSINHNIVTSDFVDKDFTHKTSLSAYKDMVHCYR